MTDKYFQGLIEQTAGKIGQEEGCIVMADYDEGASFWEKADLRRYPEVRDSVSFVYHSFESGQPAEAYEPFFDLIFGTYGRRGPEEGARELCRMMEDCEIYEPHRELLLSLFQIGVCRRREPVLLCEAEYDRMRLVRGIADLLRHFVREHPFLLVVDHMELAPESTVEVVLELICRPCSGLGLVLGVSAAASSQRRSGRSKGFDRLAGELMDRCRFYHLGAGEGQPVRPAGEGKTEKVSARRRVAGAQPCSTKLTNMVELLDLEQAKKAYVFWKREDQWDREQFLLAIGAVRTYILSGQIGQAEELLLRLQERTLEGEEHSCRFHCAYWRGVCLMYRGENAKAVNYADYARTEAEFMGDEKLKFQAQLLAIRVQMAGWRGIFYCLDNVKVDDTLIGKMIKYRYNNHLAYTYIYAYHNWPAEVFATYEEGGRLPFFEKGLAIARECGNEQLLKRAYEKYLMMASVHGKNEMTIYYSTKVYQTLKVKEGVEGARIYTGIGYNLSAIGLYDLAKQYFLCAIEQLRRLALPADIAEVEYNLAINHLACEEIHEARRCLHRCVREVEKSGQGGLRVCNLSKLYSLLSLCYILIGDRITCERYQLNSRMHLEKLKGTGGRHVSSLRDFPKGDDDIFLYSLVAGLLCQSDRDHAAAYFNLERADRYFVKEEGNLFFVRKLYRKSRMSLFRQMKRQDLYGREKELLEAGQKNERRAREHFDRTILAAVPLEQGRKVMELPRPVRRIIDTLTEAGYEAFAVGGCVRDMLLGRTPVDWDITTSASPDKVKALFPRTVDTGISHGTVTVMIQKTGYEVTTYRIDGEYEDSRHPREVTFTDNLLEDLRRRDFTINAMAYNDTRGLVDAFDGEGDLARGVIRCVGEAKERFSEDALRMLRAVRFSAQLGFSIEEKTAEAVRELAPAIERVSAERIQAELVKLLVSDHPQELRKAYELGLTKVFLPEFDRMMATPQNTPHHKYSVGEHTLCSLGNIRPDRVLRIAMLLHDVAKPACRITDENGRDHFHGHPKEGAVLAEEILKRLKFDNDTIRRVSRLVLFHDDRPKVTEKTIRHSVSRIGVDLYPDLFEVKRADVLAQSSYRREEKLTYIREYEQMLQLIMKKNQCLTMRDLAVDGRDLIALGFKPGKRLGEMLEELFDHVLDCPEDNTKERLLALIREKQQE